MSAFAIWLDTFFAAFDGAILNFWHGVATTDFGKIFFTAFMKFISFTGEEGAMFITIGIILLLFRKTRKAGAGILLAVAFGGLITNLTLKHTIARIRPFNASEIYRSFWEFVGATKVGETSFPSGHTTTAMAGTLALCLSRGKKYIPVCIAYVTLIGMSRNYLMVHYPTDIIGGLLAGALAAILGFVAMRAFFNLIEKHQENKVCHFINNADFINLFKKAEAK
jgi:undecaprenyl-diphosphatase